MEHIPGALLLHEIMWDSAHSWRRLQVRQNTYFALLTMVIALCTIKHLWIWTCWTNCTVFFMSIRKVQTYNEPGRDVTWTALAISVYSVWDVTWTAINALVISSDLCSVWQFHIFHIAMTGSSLLSSCSVFLPVLKLDIHVIMSVQQALSHSRATTGRRYSQIYCP